MINSSVLFDKITLHLKLQTIFIFQIIKYPGITATKGNSRTEFYLMKERLYGYIGKTILQF